MKIVHIVPGSGGTFYCQNCFRDITLVRALRKMGHDVMMVPLYLPMFLDDEGHAANAPVFFGGVNVWLQQKLGLFRKTPRWLDRLLDAGWLLRQAARQEGATAAEGLGPMTLSMLAGSDGKQSKELARLIEWLKTQEQPDVVHISNALLLGLAKPLKEALGVPVLCTLQDEDGWLDSISEDYRQQCWDKIAEEAAYVDGFIAVSHWYAARMTERLRLRKEQVYTVHLGIALDGAAAAARPFDPPVLGYLSKMTPSLGIGILVDAFIALKQRPGLAGLRLRATGGLFGGDKQYAKKLQAKLAALGFEEDAEFMEEFDAAARKAFLDSLTVLSVPAPAGEASGMFILEANAAGVPVVQPRAGGFTEMVEETGGGVVYDVEDPNALVEALAALLENEAHANALGAHGHATVHKRFGVENMASEFSSIYTQLLEG